MFEHVSSDDHQISLRGIPGLMSGGEGAPYLTFLRRVLKSDVQVGILPWYLPPTLLCTDRRLWKHHLPATSSAGGENFVRPGWYHAMVIWSLCKQTIRCFGLSLYSSRRDVSPGSCTNFPPLRNAFATFVCRNVLDLLNFAKCIERQIFERMCSIITDRKRSLGQGNVFNRICHSVHRGGGGRGGGGLSPGQSPPLDRVTLGQRPSWTETPLDKLI